jgi:23S rRNA (adenine2503-C2)-methyltransferase
MQEAERPINLYGLERDALLTQLQPLGAAPYQADQAFRWMYAKDRLDPDDWSDFSKNLREVVRTRFRIEAGDSADRLTAADGTVKHRFALAGGEAVESVFMRYDRRITLCVSSQVGCALGCRFCLTATMGLRRHLTSGEILGQISCLRREHELLGQHFNLVFMGMGEPLHNYDAVLPAIRILTDPKGFGLSPKKISVSTVGLVPRIDQLADETVRPRLAVSLNATTDELRDRLMPVNRRWPLAELFASLTRYTKKTGDSVFFEYVLMEGVNDSDEDIERLRKLTSHLPTKINLIPFNPVPDKLPFRSPPAARIEAIRDRLASRGVRVMVRWSRGVEARAACGQLALDEYAQKGGKR